MREIEIGSQTVRLRASTPALLFYKQEFNKDLVGDLLKMIQGMVGVNALRNASNIDLDIADLNLGSLDSIMLLQVIWAMAKADSFGKAFPSFERWIHELDDFNIFDEFILNAVIQEAVDGFFRKGAGRKSVAPSAR